MALTDKYDLEEIDYGTTGWNGIQQNNNEIIDDNLPTRQIDTLGENVSAYDAVYIKSDGKAWKAQADGSKQPAVGLMIEAGSASDADKRYQVMGEITNAGWSWTNIGQPVYLSPVTPGALTETAPNTDNKQVIGIIKSATKILLTATWQTSFISDQPYIVGGGYTGIPSASLVIARHPFTRWEATFPSGLTGSKMVAGTAATAEAVFSFKKDSGAGPVEFGTATFAIAGTVATFAGAGTKCTENDILTVVAPASPDATLADLGFSLLGTRSYGTTTTTSTTTSTSSSTSSTTASSTSTSSSTSSTTA